MEQDTKSTFHYAANGPVVTIDPIASQHCERFKPFCDALVAALAKQASSPKLRTLSISANRLSDEMIEALHKLSKARTFLLLSRPQLLSELLTNRREWLGE